MYPLSRSRWVSAAGLHLSIEKASDIAFPPFAVHPLTLSPPLTDVHSSPRRHRRSQNGAPKERNLVRVPPSSPRRRPGAGRRRSFCRRSNRLRRHHHRRPKHDGTGINDSSNQHTEDHRASHDSSDPNHRRSDHRNTDCRSNSDTDRRSDTDSSADNGDPDDSSTGDGSTGDDSSELDRFTNVDELFAGCYNCSASDGAELVTVEVTETTLGDGTTSYSYVIITRSDGTEKTIVLSPTTSSDSSSGGSDNSSPAQPDSSQSDSSKASKSMGVGAIVGIIVAAVVFMLVLFAFFIAQRRHNKHQPSDASSEDFLESPVVGKQVRLLELGQSPADTEYQEITRTTANSRSTGSSMPDGRRHRGTLWEDPVILASRIPIDRIELGAVISRGGFGVVYRGRYRDQDVAIKTLLPEKRKDLAHIQAFLSEVRLVATMEHPHIVQFIGVAWESLSDLFCVTEFMSGGDLRSLLKDYLANGVPQGMDAGKTQIAYQVAYALTYLHSLEPVVLHRDLKSRNILLTERLDAKITDFGASRIRSDATMTAGVGSSLWMAPEVMMGQRYGEKADVFSLGVVISELDTHELPYSHAKESNSNSGRPLPDTAVLQMVSMGKLRVRFSSFMDADMARFVCSCVSVEPEQRPTAAEVLYYLQVATRNRQY
ncbi:hypothetical protein PRNP1_001509 [Phytophthora ramorum]